MEKPKTMSSAIVEKDAEIIITTPKRKSWVLIIGLFVLILYFSFGLAHVFFPDGEVPMVGRISMAAIFMTFLCFAVRSFGSGLI